MHRLSGDDYEARNRRRRRAIDLSLKRKTMPKDQQNFEPYDSYMGDILEDVQREHNDKRELAV